MLNNTRWRLLFLFCLGLATASAFCMKWMEGDFLLKGETFSILDLEFFYTKEELSYILANIDDPTRRILKYHLVFDFAFMAGVFPGIAALCMMAREKIKAASVKKIFFSLAALQLLAWGCDITENIYLLNWTAHKSIGNDHAFFKFVVWLKWAIAIAGVLAAIPFVWRKKSPTPKESYGQRHKEY